MFAYEQLGEIIREALTEGEDGDDLISYVEETVEEHNDAEATLQVVITITTTQQRAQQAVEAISWDTHIQSLIKYGSEDGFTVDSLEIT